MSALLQAAAAVDQWLGAAEESASEVAFTALGRESLSVAQHSATPPHDLSGAYVQLMSDREVVHIGLCAEPDVLRRLAGALVGDETALSTADITDAVGEIVNMLAGGVKRRMVSTHPGLQLGLPVFIHGHLEPRERQHLRVARVLVGPSDQFVLVVMHESRALRGDAGG
jgi:hypothetical protein